MHVESEKMQRRYRISYEVHHGEHCYRTESEDVGAASEEEALRRFFSERLYFGGDVFADAIEELEMTLAGGNAREPIRLPDDETGEQNDRVLDLVITTALSARFIGPAGGPAPVIKWWEGGGEDFLQSLENVEDVTGKQVCPTCDGSGEVETRQG